MCEQFHLYFLGSVEVPYHKGNDILCQAMHKVPKAVLAHSPGFELSVMVSWHVSSTV